MAKTKQQKEQTIKALKESLDKQKAIVFVDFAGLKVGEMFDLRKKLKAAKANIKVIKKTLINKVFKEKKLELDPSVLKGEIAVAFGFGDEISPAKISYEFSRQNKNLKILCGFLENEFKTGEQVIELAQLPSREQLLARLVGSISAPASNFVRVLEGNIKGLVYTLNAIASKNN
jgi:large subunit ribosomal protein L10